MNYFLKILIIFKISLLLISCVEKKCIETDILIIGGGASGVAAGVQIARKGANALIVEENEWLGGMLTSAGVSAIDGNDNLPAGLWGESKTRLMNHYGHCADWKTGWVRNVLFEPTIGNQVVYDMLVK